MRKPFITVRLTHGMLGALLVSTCACSGTKWTEVEKDSIRIVTQQEGAVLGYSANSGVRLLTVDGYAFKDLNRNGLLDPYEDWRLTPEERAVDLAVQLSTEEIGGCHSGELRCTKPSGLGYHQWKSRAFRFVAFADAGRYAYRGGAIRGCSPGYEMLYGQRGPSV